MTGLLDQALQAHGGLQRWHKTTRLTAHARIGGELWGRRGQPDALTDAHIQMDPHPST